jgi:ABC-type multidrug transport system permease subunit
MSGARAHAAVTAALVRRALNEILRVPGAAIPGVLAPAIFMLGLTSVFGSLTDLRGFPTDDYLAFILPVSLMQGAGFAGSAMGVNLARDVEHGWFDRILVTGAPRPVVLAGLVGSAAVRCFLPMSFLLAVGFAFGVPFPGGLGFLLAVVLPVLFAAVAATWTITLALRFKTQAASPLMLASSFTAVLFTTSYAPQELLTGWLQDVARWNPVTKVLEAVRQGFVGDVTWATTWPAFGVIAGLSLLLSAVAVRELNRTGA